MEILYDEDFAISHWAKVEPRWWRRKRTLVMIGVFLSLVITLLASLTHAVLDAQEAARRSQCVCNLCGIKLALHNYESAHGALPPAFIADANGKPMHSWRVLILPFMEHQDLYNSYNFKEPWDGPNNIKLLDKMPGNFACPSWHPNHYTSPTNLTSYVVISGPGTMFTGKPTTSFEGVKFAEIKDGLSNTLMVVEVSNVKIPWTAPIDLDVRTMSLRVNDPKRPGISSKHPRGANVAFGDGRTRFMHDTITPDGLKSIISIAGGESGDAEQILSGEKANEAK